MQKQLCMLHGVHVSTVYIMSDSSDSASNTTSSESN
jgi:hypothetical protein